MIPLYDDVKKDSFGLLIWLILIVNVVASITIFRLPAEQSNHILEHYTINNIKDLNVFSFLIKSFFSMNIHGDFWHLFTNMLFLVAFGISLENKTGKLLFTTLYLGAGMCGCFLYSILAKSNLPVVGASGAISGLMASYLILFPKAKLMSLWPILWIVRFIYVPSWFYVGIWIIVQIIFSIFDKNSYIAYEAHLGGILFGLAFGIFARYFFNKRKKPK